MRKTRLRPRSVKVESWMKLYRPELAARLKLHPWCEYCRNNRSKDGHHYAGSRRGSNLLRFVVLCRPCHDFIEAHGIIARALGWKAQVNGSLEYNPSVIAAEARYNELLTPA